VTKKKAVKACAVQHLQGKTSLEARLQRSAACRRTEEAQAAYIETYREDNEMSRALRHEAHDARDLLLPFLLNRPEGLAVDMDVVLLADPQMLHAEPDGMTGRVAKYALRLSRPGA